MPITVRNPFAFGKLMKSWATGNNYFKDDPTSPLRNGVPPLPRTMADFVKICTDAGADVTVPPEITGLEFIQYSSNTFVIKLPPKDLVEKSEALIQSGGAYPIPPFYDEFFTLPTMDTDTKMRFHAIRTADYICGQCG